MQAAALDTPSLAWRVANYGLRSWEENWRRLSMASSVRSSKDEYLYNVFKSRILRRYVERVDDTVVVQCAPPWDAAMEAEARHRRLPDDGRIMHTFIQKAIRQSRPDPEHTTVPVVFLGQAGTRKQELFDITVAQLCAGQATEVATQLRAWTATVQLLTTAMSFANVQQCSLLTQLDLVMMPNPNADADADAAPALVLDFAYSVHGLHGAHLRAPKADYKRGLVNMPTSSCLIFALLETQWTAAASAEVPEADEAERQCRSWLGLGPATRGHREAQQWLAGHDANYAYHDSLRVAWGRHYHGIQRALLGLYTLAFVSQFGVPAYLRLLEPALVLCTTPHAADVVELPWARDASWQTALERVRRFMLATHQADADADAAAPPALILEQLQMSVEALYTTLVSCMLNSMCGRRPGPPDAPGQRRPVTVNLCNVSGFNLQTLTTALDLYRLGDNHVQDVLYAHWYQTYVADNDTFGSHPLLVMDSAIQPALSAARHALMSTLLHVAGDEAIRPQQLLQLASNGIPPDTLRAIAAPSKDKYGPEGKFLIFHDFHYDARRDSVSGGLVYSAQHLVTEAARLRRSGASDHVQTTLAHLWPILTTNPSSVLWVHSMETTPHAASGDSFDDDYVHMKLRCLGLMQYIHDRARGISLMPRDLFLQTYWFVLPDAHGNYRHYRIPEVTHPQTFMKDPHQYMSLYMGDHFVHYEAPTMNNYLDRYSKEYTIVPVQEFVRWVHTLIKADRAGALASVTHWEYQRYLAQYQQTVQVADLDLADTWSTTHSKVSAWYIYNGNQRHVAMTNAMYYAYQRLVKYVKVHMIVHRLQPLYQQAVADALHTWQHVDAAQQEAVRRQRIRQRFREVAHRASRQQRESRQQNLLAKMTTLARHADTSAQNHRVRPAWQRWKDLTQQTNQKLAAWQARARRLVLAKVLADWQQARKNQKTNAYRKQQHKKQLLRQLQNLAARYRDNLASAWSALTAPPPEEDLKTDKRHSRTEQGKQQRQERRRRVRAVWNRLATRRTFRQWRDWTSAAAANLSTALFSKFNKLPPLDSEAHLQRKSTNTPPDPPIMASDISPATTPRGVMPPTPDVLSKLGSVLEHIIQDQEAFQQTCECQKDVQALQDALKLLQANMEQHHTDVTTYVATLQDRIVASCETINAAHTFIQKCENSIRDMQKQHDDLAVKAGILQGMIMTQPELVNRLKDFLSDKKAPVEDVADADEDAGN